MGAGNGIDQLAGYANLATRLPHAALKHIRKVPKFSTACSIKSSRVFSIVGAVLIWSSFSSNALRMSSSWLSFRPLRK